jgi:hypothetical protein
VAGRLHTKGLMHDLTNNSRMWGIAAVLVGMLLGGVVRWQPIRVRHSHIPDLDICTVEGPDERYPMGFYLGQGLVVEWRWGAWH